MKPEEFAQALCEAYTEGRGIFANKVNAEDLVPKSASNLQKALFLFYVLQLDYATKSQRLYAGAKKLFATEPSFFDPVFINYLSPKKLETYLQKYLHPRYLNEATKRYQINTELLLRKYHGEPRIIFTTSQTAAEVLSKIREFRGFGPKIVHFFFRTMVNTFGYQYPDLEDVLQPVDVWDVRIAYLLGFSVFDKMTESNIQQTKELWQAACKKAGVSWLTFDKALWLLGSEGKPKTNGQICDLLR